MSRRDDLFSFGCHLPVLHPRWKNVVGVEYRAEGDASRCLPPCACPCQGIFSQVERTAPKEASGAACLKNPSVFGLSIHGENGNANAIAP